MIIPIILVFLSMVKLIHANSDNNICETDGCKYVSDHLSSMANMSADPCDNFYEFVCGSYLNATRYSSNYTVLNYIVTTKQLIDNTTLNGLLNVDLRDKNVAKAYKYARRYYDACVDYDPTDSASQQEIVDYLVNFDNWPFLNKSWRADQFDVVKAVGKLQGELDISRILKLRIVDDKLNYSRRVLYLSSGNMKFLSPFYIKPVFTRVKRNYVVVVSKALQQLIINAKVTHHTVRSINKAAKEIVEFEAYLAELQRGDIPDHSYTLVELNNVTNSSLVWSRYFKAVLGTDTRSLKWLDENKVVANLNFTSLVHMFHSTPLEVIANYLMWRLLDELGSYFDPNFFQIETIRDQEVLRNLSYGSNKPLTNEHSKSSCLDETNSLFEHVAARFYINQRYRNTSKHEVALKLGAKLLKAVKQIIKQNGWLSTEAKKRVVAKLDNLVLNIGYPRWIMNDTLLNDYYKTYRIRANYSYFRAQIVFKRFRSTKLHESVDRHEFRMPVITPRNAEFHQLTNTVTIPAGLLELFFFGADFPEVYNAGVVGTIIGHEIFHGFDNHGVWFDENGQYYKAGVLADSIKLFQNLTQCLVVDYNQYCYNLPPAVSQYEPEENGESTGENLTPLLTGCVNGKYTLNENIADLNGIKASYFAFKDLYKDVEYEQLKGFEIFTAEQMFFVSYASSYCGRFSNDLKVVKMVLSDGHSPKDVRVNALLRNFPEFREAFKCPSNSFMYSNNNNESCTIY